MDKKIYALKDGNHPGIYLAWLDFYQEIQKLKYFDSRSFGYKAELMNEPADVEGSLRYAIDRAREYLGEEHSQIYGEAPQPDEKPDIEEDDDKDDDLVSVPFDEVCEPEPSQSVKDDWEAEAKALAEMAKEDKRELDSKIRSSLGLDSDSRFGSPWLDMILNMEKPDLSTAKGFSTGNIHGYVGRYFPQTLYYRILYAVLEPENFVDDYFLRENLMEGRSYYGSLPRESIVFEFKFSDEYEALSERLLEKNGMSSYDLAEVRNRCQTVADTYRNSWAVMQSKPVTTLKAFLESGPHTIWDVYLELVGNATYRKDLLDVSGPFYNPDLALREVAGTENMTLKEMVLQTNAISIALKSNILGQNGAIDKLEHAFFHGTKDNGKRKGPRNVFLFAGSPGVGKTFMAENFAKVLGMSYKRFDMSGYANRDSLDELEGISTFWKYAKPGTLTSYVADNPRSVILFDEIEKAAGEVIRMFLQILDEGRGFDRYYDRNVDFRNCILIFTTNAGRQLYQEAEGEDLSQISDKVIIKALEDDRDSNGNPFFPPELVSRFSSNTIILFNRLGADVIRHIIQNDVEKQIERTRERYGIDVSAGRHVLATTAQYSVGGKQDARSASKIAGKIIDKALYELLMLVEEKTGLNKEYIPEKISFQCDYENASGEVLDFYEGEKKCVIPVLTRSVPEKSEIKVFGKNQVEVLFFPEREAFIEAVEKKNILFSVIDYNLGRSPEEKSLDISDVNSEGSRVFFQVRKDNPSLPVYLLLDDEGYGYSEREKYNLLSLGVKGFINNRNFYRELKQLYYDICCIRAVDTLSVRHQVLTYETRKELDLEHKSARIIFYNLKLEMAVDAEDKNTLISEGIKPNKRWSDIYVSEDVKSELQFFINYLRNPKEYRMKGVRAPKGALMYGPPGTGKTSLAKVVATESNVNFLSVGADELMGGGAKKVHETFQVARKYAPAVLFIDEIDAIGFSRNFGTVNPALNALLVEIDGFKNLEQKPVFVMAATNLGENIDEALVRRFDRSFCVDLPKKEGRKWILEKLLSAHRNMFDISEQEVDSITERSAGMSPANIENVIESALREGIRNNCKVDDDMLDDAFERCRYGEENDRDSEKEIRHTAYHEAGHAVVHLHYGNTPSYMSVVSRGNFGGYVKPEKMGEHPTKEKLLQRICMSLGGRAAELECGYGLTPGASSDLQQATNLAKSMVCAYGMYEDEVGLAVISDEELRYNEKAKQVINQILSEQLKQARQIIREERENLERLVEAVLTSKQKYLTKKDLEGLYHG